MSSGPPTSLTLIDRVQRHEDGAWSRFVEVYEPAMHAFLRAKGLQDADALDVTQEALRGVAAGIGDWKADSQRGTFRTWLFTVIRRKLIDFWRTKDRHPQGSGDTEVRRQLEAVEDHRTDAALWDLEYERRLFQYAAEQVESEVDAVTWRAFWLTAVEGHGAADAAAELGVRVGNVYVARSRVMRRLRKKVAEYTDQPSIDEIVP